MDDDDFKELVQDISESLNIHIEVIETVKTVEANDDRLNELNFHLDVLQKENEGMAKNLAVALAEAEKAKNQLEIMKEMYANLLEKVL